MEPAGTAFCGSCGTQLGGGGLLAALAQRPYLAALVGGAAFSVVVVLALALLGGGDGSGTSAGSSSNSSGSALSSGSVTTTAVPGAGGDATRAPQSTATTAVETPEPTEKPPTETPVPPTPTPLPPTATNVPPSPTPVPPTATLPPPPTATSGPSIPPQKTSSLVSLSITGGHGSSHPVGQQVTLCYGSLAGQYIRLLDFQPPGTLNNVIREGIDDGTGECINGTIEPPAGFEVFRVEVLNSTRTSVVDFAEIWIIVTP